MAYQSNYNGQEIDDAIALVQQIFDKIYPIGSLYFSLGATSPASLFGGTWQKLEDKFIMAAGTENAVGATGGSKTHTHTSAAHSHTTQGYTLTVNEMPSHSHAANNVSTNATYKTSFQTVKNLSSSSTARRQLATSSSSGIYANTYNSGAADYEGSDCSADVNTATSGGGASHSHGNTGSTTPGATGATAAPPPYIAVNIWQRTT